MHAIIAEDDNLVILTDHDGRIVECYELQRLSFTDSLKTIDFCKLMSHVCHAGLDPASGDFCLGDLFIQIAPIRSF